MAGDCCALGSSCNTCPFSYSYNRETCAGRGDFKCNSDPNAGDAMHYSTHYELTDGRCRGGQLAWPEGGVWRCVHSNDDLMTWMECAQACLDEDLCESFDTSISPEATEDTGGNCCLFREGYSGDGYDRRWC